MTADYRHAGLGWPNGAVAGGNDRILRLPSRDLLMLGSEHWHYDEAESRGKDVLFRGMARPGFRPAEVGWSPTRYVDEILRDARRVGLDKIRRFVAWNELNLQDERGDHKSDHGDLTELFRLIGLFTHEVVKILRRELPQAELHYGAFAPKDETNYINLWSEAAAACDVVDAHGYGNGPGIIRHIEKYQRLFPEKRIDLTEWHSYVHDGEKGEDRWRRDGDDEETLTLLSAHGTRAYYFMYDWQNPPDHQRGLAELISLAGNEGRYDLFMNPPRASVGPSPEPTPRPEPAPMVTYNPNEPPHPQDETFDCSQESLEWALASLGLPYDDEELERLMIGEGVMSSGLGLLDATGAGLAAFAARAYSDFGIQANHESSVSFEWAAREGDHAYPVLIGGRAWNHWCAVRGYDAEGDRLLLANSAQGHMGVGQTMSREQFGRLGPFSAVRIWHPDLLGAAPTQPTEPPTQPPVVTERPKGIDVSSWQGDPDWAAVRAAGVQFAIIKATEGVNYVNPHFLRSWNESRANGLVRGAYHYAQPRLNGPLAEADHFIWAVRQVGLEAGDVLALDIEENSADLAGWTLAFLERVSGQLGFKPLLYTNADFIRRHGLGTAELGAYGLWLASWGGDAMPAPPRPSHWPTVALWQYSATGRVPGIAGDVDMNLFNGPLDRLKLYGAPALVPVVPPAPEPSAPTDLGVLADLLEESRAMLAIPALPKPASKMLKQDWRDRAHLLEQLIHVHYAADGDVKQAILDAAGR